VQGFGRFEFAKALYFNDTSTFKAMAISDTQTLTQDAPFRICLSYFGTGPLAVTLAWFDDPPTPGSGVALVNDLDLLVYEHDTGKTWRGNNAPGFDHANTVEHIEMQPNLGKYVVMVYGTTVQRLLSFSLILTGDFAVADCFGSSNSSYTQCPNGCSDPNNDCMSALCICNDESVGPDCSMISCPPCGANGECDYTFGTCLCDKGLYGPSCALTYTSLLPMEIDQTHSTSLLLGQSVGLFAGLFVLVYCLGCILAAVSGIVCGQKFLEWRRDRAARR